MDSEDAYGHQLYDYYKGKSDGLEIVERDDGFIQANQGPRTYLSRYKDWSRREKTAIHSAKGSVLDIGCGGARHSLYPQEKGHPVIGVDISPLALKVAKLRGLKDSRNMSITDIGPSMGRFDTILMLGNNFGLFANPRQAKQLLRKFSGSLIRVQRSLQRVWTPTRRVTQTICNITGLTENGEECLVRSS